MDYKKLSEALKAFITTDRDYNLAMFKIGLFEPELSAALDEYLETGVLPQISAGEIGFKEIMGKTGCNEMQAFFNMDNLMKNAEYRKHFMNMSFGRK